MSGRSKLSREILQLYANYMRLSRNVNGLKGIARAEFKQYKHLHVKNNLIYIEYLLRRGKQQLLTLKGKGVTSISTYSSSTKTEKS